jgi:hypothetical protein
MITFECTMNGYYPLFFPISCLQAHFSRAELPISDYVTDLKSVLDQSIRIIQAMIDICANSGWLSSALTCMHLLQMIIQVNFIVSDFSLSPPPLSQFVVSPVSESQIDILF